MQEEWHDITVAFDVYEIQVTADGRIRYRPKFYMVG
jgi:hypothetical protein